MILIIAFVISIIVLLLHWGAGNYVGADVRDAYVDFYFAWTKKLTKFQWVAILAVVLGVGFLVENAGTQNMVKEQPKKYHPSEEEAYFIAKEFAKNTLGSASFGWAHDGLTDYGDGSFHVTGVADIPGRRFRWTIEIQYNGGEWNDINNWTNKGFFYE